MGGCDGAVEGVAEKVVQVIGPQAFHADHLKGMKENRQAGVFDNLQRPACPRTIAVAVAGGPYLTRRRSTMSGARRDFDRQWE